MGVKGTNCGGINLKHPMILMPTYSARLSSREAVTVRADVERGPIRIMGGKRRKYRHISPMTYQEIFERARNSFASHPLESGGVYLRHIQELSGHKDSKTTETYTHVSTKELSKIKSPFDMMGGEKHSE